MPIKAKCRKCSKVYNVKDDLAGKKFRCKECSSPVTVPTPKVEVPAEPEEDLFASDDFGSFDDDYDDEFDDFVPTKRASPKKKPVVKKKKKKKRSSSGPGIGSRIAGIFGAVFGFFIAFAFVVRLFTAIGGAGLLDFGISWQSYTTPDGNVSVLLPGPAKSVPARSVAPGGQSYGASRKSFACVITIEPMTGILQGFTEQEVFDAFNAGAGFVGASNVQQTQMNGRNCIRFETKAPNGVKAENLAFVYKDKVYTLNCVYKGMKGSKDKKFFESIQFH